MAVPAESCKPSPPGEQGWHCITKTMPPALGHQDAPRPSPEARESNLKAAKSVLCRESGHRHLTFLIYPREGQQPVSLCSLVPWRGGDSDTRQLFNLPKKSHNESQRLEGGTKQIQSRNKVN